METRTDGGEKSKDAAAARHERFLALFTEVTGTDELVDEQESMESTRLVDDTTTALSEYVMVAMSDDGLIDTIDEPERGDQD